jgi:hypothetical protein
MTGRVHDRDGGRAPAPALTCLRCTREVAHGSKCNYLARRLVSRAEPASAVVVADGSFDVNRENVLLVDRAAADLNLLANVRPTAYVRGVRPACRPSAIDGRPVSAPSVATGPRIALACAERGSRATLPHDGRSARPVQFRPLDFTSLPPPMRATRRRTGVRRA